MDAIATSQRPMRVPLSVPVSVTLLDGSAPPCACVSGNVSMGGMFVRTSAAPSAGQHVMVALEALGKATPLAEAEVVWVRRDEIAGQAAGFGLRFLRFEPDAQALLENLTGESVSAPVEVVPSELPNVLCDPALGAYQVPVLLPEPPTRPDGVAALLVAQKRTRSQKARWSVLLAIFLAAALIGGALFWLVFRL
jgi:Tfp pilus assembly protein PilZ